jgi:hypothetical protein
MWMKSSPAMELEGRLRTVAEPDEGWRMLTSSLMRVVFPAPLWPSNAKMLPCGMLSVVGLRAGVCFPKDRP